MSKAELIREILEDFKAEMEAKYTKEELEARYFALGLGRGDGKHTED